jgi:hypothetical protein
VVRRRPLLLIACVGVGAGFVALASAYNAVTPLWEAPDEVGHMAFVEHLVRHRRLPVPDPTDLGEAHQPPLYYVVAALAVRQADLDDPRGRFRFNRNVVWLGGNEANAARHGADERFPWRGHARAVHAARAVSTLIGAQTVLLTVALATTALHGGPADDDNSGVRRIALLSGGLVAFNPQFAFISAAVSNDGLAALASTCALLALVRAIRRPDATLRWALVGAALAAALLTKLTTATLAVLDAGCLLAAAWIAGSPAIAVRGTLAVASLVLLCAGWWFARNVLLLGDPLGISLLQSALAPVLRRSPLTLVDLADFASTQLRSFWGVFGWMTVPAPRWYRAAVAALTGAAAVGLVRAAFCRAPIALTPPRRAGLVLLAAAVALQEAAQLAAIRTFDASWYQGRYLFPVIAPIAILLATGLLALVPTERHGVAVLLLLAALAACAAAFPFTVIGPALGAPGGR